MEQVVEMTQEYLNKNHDGLIVDGLEFRNLVKEYFTTDQYPLAQMARENAAFGSVYIYMCIYYKEIIENGQYTDNLNLDITIDLPANILQKTIEEISHDDIRKDFKDNYLPSILSGFLKEKSQTIEPTKYRQ